MMFRNFAYRLTVVFSLMLFLLAGATIALADQVTLSYIDVNSNPDTITLDCNTSTADLALAASLLGEDVVSILNDPDAGCGTVAEIAAAMATAAPVFSASIAEAFAAMSPADTADIVAAINAVPGVNSVAVLAAVHFGPAGTLVGPQTIGSDSAISLKLMQTEKIPSEN